MSNVVLLILDVGVPPEFSTDESNNYCDSQIAKALLLNNISGDIKEISPDSDLNIGDNI